MNSIARVVERSEVLDEVLDYLTEFKRQNPDARKQQVEQAFVGAFAPRRARSVYRCDGFGVRFCEARTGSFSNTVLSLSALRQHDHSPLVLVVVRGDRIEYLLANSTLLHKVSHSSVGLRVDRVRGSFNGTDVIREYAGLRNERANLGALFERHMAVTWEENLERLVDATNGIRSTRSGFRPSAEQRARILEAPERAAAMITSPSFGAIAQELTEVVLARRGEVLDLVGLENVNLRGNEIEALVNPDAFGHRLDDLVRDTPDGLLSIDVKSKLLDRSSAPKAYNVDKMLEFLSTPRTVAAIFAVGIDPVREQVTTSLVPVLDRSLLAITRMQHHWAARGSRGVTQFSGSFANVFAPGFSPEIDIDRACEFLQLLVDRTELLSRD